MKEKRIIDARLTREVLIERIEERIVWSEEAEKWYSDKAKTYIEGNCLITVYRERADNEKIKIAMLEDLLRDVTTV